MLALEIAYLIASTVSFPVGAAYKPKTKKILFIILNYYTYQINAVVYPIQTVAYLLHYLIEF
jgi:hypothetical protein